MNGPICIDRDNHRTWLKWHRARKKASDTAFTAERIREGMALGARIEIDLRLHAGRGFAVLHDADLTRETTGNGLIAKYQPDQLRQLFLRDNQGLATQHPVLLLEDLTRQLSGTTPHPEAVLQLDLKETADALDATAIDQFQAAVGAFSRNIVLSGEDVHAIDLLSERTPDLSVGYDPCSDESLERLFGSRDFEGFVSSAVAASPRATMIYLYYPVVIEAARHDYDIVAAFHQHGRTVDAWTIAALDEASLENINTLLRCKVDQITTDDPEGVSARFHK
jgi:glycerophosphoryl diester phosphodiesterase